MKKEQNLMPLSFVILGALLTWCSISMTAPATSGQMMTGPSMMNKNMNWTMPVMRGDNITGSINLMSTISKAIASEVNVSLSEVSLSAEKSVGNGSHAVAAHIDVENGYLVYNVFVVDSNGKMHKVIIDPSDGKILLSRELSGFESMMVMHQGMAMRGQRMMSNEMMGRGEGW